MSRAHTKLLAAAFVFGIVSCGAATQAFAADSKACQQLVQSTKNELKAVDYDTPSKPNAMRVAGKFGHENTAGEVNFMQRQIKLAETDCNAGNQTSAMQRVSSIQGLLDAHGDAAETANAALKQQ